MARAARTGSRFDVTLLGACVLLALVLRGLPADRRETIARPLRVSIMAPLVSLQHGAVLTRAAIETHDARMLSRDSIALRETLIGSLQNENERLRRLLGLGRQLRWGFIPAEGLTSGVPGQEYTLTLTAGARQGVRRYSAVVAPEGLVGMVETVDPRTSVAILWSHPDFRVSAMATDGSAFGIVAAHLEDGASRHLLELRGVPRRNELPRGMLIVSSGLGSVFPRGIPIGIVLGEQPSPEEQWARTYLLRPAVLPSEVSSVMILIPERGAAGVDGVWPKVSELDSAAAPAAGGPAASTTPAARPAVDSAPPPRPRVRRDTQAVADSTAAAAAAAAARAAARDSARRDSLRADSVLRQRVDTPRIVPNPFRIDTPRPRPDTPRADTARRRPDSLRPRPPDSLPPRPPDSTRAEPEDTSRSPR